MHVGVNIAVENLVRAQETCRSESDATSNELITFSQRNEKLHAAMVIGLSDITKAG
jgi:hypothetical protein